MARIILSVTRRTYVVHLGSGTNEMATRPGTNWLETVLAFGFGLAALATVLWLAFRGGDLTEQQFEILRIVLALAGGGVGAIIPGFLHLNLKAGSTLALRAGGALAVFVVLYFWSPARWQPAAGGHQVTMSAPGGVAASNISQSPITINNHSAGTMPAK